MLNELGPNDWRFKAIKQAYNSNPRKVGAVVRRNPNAKWEQIEDTLLDATYEDMTYYTDLLRIEDPNPVKESRYMMKRAGLLNEEEEEDLSAWDDLDNPFDGNGGILQDDQAFRIVSDDEDVEFDILNTKFVPTTPQDIIRRMCNAMEDDITDSIDEHSDEPFTRESWKDAMGDVYEVEYIGASIAKGYAQYSTRMMSTITYITSDADFETQDKFTQLWADVQQKEVGWDGGVVNDPDMFMEVEDAANTPVSGEREIPEASDPEAIILIGKRLVSYEDYQNLSEDDKWNLVCDYLEYDLDYEIEEEHENQPDEELVAKALDLWLQYNIREWEDRLDNSKSDDPQKYLKSLLDDEDQLLEDVTEVVKELMLKRGMKRWVDRLDNMLIDIVEDRLELILPDIKKDAESKDWTSDLKKF